MAVNTTGVQLFAIYAPLKKVRTTKGRLMRSKSDEHQKVISAVNIILHVLPYALYQA